MSGHDSKYFSTTKKGEIPELKEELNSQYKDNRKDAVKKVIAAMTVGKDVSSLFTDVVNCMQTECGAREACLLESDKLSKNQTRSCYPRSKYFCKGFTIKEVKFYGAVVL